MPHLTLTQREAKLVTCTIKINDVTMDLSGSSYKFLMKKDRTQAAYDLEIDNTDFVVSQENVGIVSFFLTQDKLDLEPGQYTGEFIVHLNDVNSTILKCPTLSIEILKTFDND